ncbi:MAG: flagellar hook-basal body complex protein FliE [Pigmentiphaga sp.]
MIKNVVEQMQQVAAMAASRPAAPTAGLAPVPGNFATELQRSLARVGQAQDAAYAQAQAYELGTPGVSLDHVMIESQKAGIAFQTAVQVRNRLIAAYQEISSMPV